MSGETLLLVVASSAAIAAVVGVAAWILLRLMTRAPIMVHLVTVAAAAVSAVVGGILIASNAMYLSETDVQLALAIALSSGAVAILVAVLLGGRVARAAGILRSAAADLGNGVPIQTAAETGLSIGEFRAVLDELAASDARLRAARSEIERQERARQDLVVRITHDLRVPLAGIRAQAEALQDGVAPDPDRFLTRIVGQVDRVDRLVDDLFAVSRLDAGALALRLEPTSLGDLASDVVADVRAVADAAAIELTVDIRRDAVAEVDPLQLGRALANLVANALQHTPEGSGVRVVVDADRARARIAVEDGGPGIREDDSEHLFSAGWRGTEARSPHAVDITAGAGLGLAIARGIARAHGGDVTAANTPSGGAVFTLEVPARP
ncbi:MAG: hypothetical protein ABS61_00160 [Microbacterium sp. SCN 70-18]|nr:MAG: hypothetical protein ABS61_00160 [Microbacterium sp. SCN 70-18]